MLSQTEAHRLAAAINQLRPDWPLASLSSWIRKNLGERAYRDAAVALTWVATDPATTTPGRVLEAGPWWRAVVANKGTTSTVTHMCPEHPDHAAWNCTECQSAAVPPPAAYLAAKAAIPRRPVVHTHPAPPATDVTDARARIDTEQDTP